MDMLSYLLAKNSQGGGGGGSSVIVKSFTSTSVEPLIKADYTSKGFYINKDFTNDRMYYKDEADGNNANLPNNILFFELTSDIETAQVGDKVGYYYAVGTRRNTASPDLIGNLMRGDIVKNDPQYSYNSKYYDFSSNSSRAYWWLTNNDQLFYGVKKYDAIPELNVDRTYTNAKQLTSKKYVDELPTTYTGYDATKTQVLKNVNGTFTWVDE